MDNKPLEQKTKTWINVFLSFIPLILMMAIIVFPQVDLKQSIFKSLIFMLTFDLIVITPTIFLTQWFSKKYGLESNVEQNSTMDKLTLRRLAIFMFVMLIGILILAMVGFKVAEFFMNWLF